MAYVNAYNRRLEGPDDPDALPEKTEHSTRTARRRIRKILPQTEPEIPRPLRQNDRISKKPDGIFRPVFSSFSGRQDCICPPQWV